MGTKYNLQVAYHTEKEDGAIDTARASFFATAESNGVVCVSILTNSSDRMAVYIPAEEAARVARHMMYMAEYVRDMAKEPGA